MQLLIEIKNNGREKDDHNYLERNVHENMENKPGENGMYIPPLLYVINTFILSPPGNSIRTLSFSTRAFHKFHSTVASKVPVCYILLRIILKYLSISFRIPSFLSFLIARFPGISQPHILYYRMKLFTLKILNR
jgi:hypothetical protein